MCPLSLRMPINDKSVILIPVYIYDGGFANGVAQLSS